MTKTLHGKAHGKAIALDEDLGVVAPRHNERQPCQQTARPDIHCLV